MGANEAGSLGVGAFCEGCRNTTKRYGAIGVDGDAREGERLLISRVRLKRAVAFVSEIGECERIAVDVSEGSENDIDCTDDDTRTCEIKCWSLYKLLGSHIVSKLYRAFNWSLRYCLP